MGSAVAVGGCSALAVVKLMSTSPVSESGWCHPGGYGDGRGDGAALRGIVRLARS
jgi:hypothetical protein